MNWYYALGGQQQGPVEEAQFDALIAAGTITPDTLVWREGMPNWLPLREARPTASAPGVPPVVGLPPVVGAASPGANEIVCAECGKIFTRDNAIQYGTSWVCATCKPVFLQKLREGATPGGVARAAGDVHYAGFWIRFLAKFVDGLVAMVVLGIPFGIIIFTSMSKMTPGQPPTFVDITGQILFQLFTVFFGIAYNTFMIGKYGATLGKMAVGIRVVTPEGEPISYMRAFGRAWADILSGMICYIGYIIAAFDSEKRALHDHICTTRVVYKPR